MFTIVRRTGLALSSVMMACSTPHHPPAPDTAWLGSIDQFHAKRNDEIGGQDGWLTLVTRTWLPNDGPFRVGSDPSSDVVLPVDRSPPLAGTLFRRDGHHRFVAAEGVSVTVNGTPQTELEPLDDRDGHPTVWALGSLTFRIIKRQDRFALRVKDTAHPSRAAFKGLTFYEPNPKWRLRARFEAAPPGKTLPIVNVLEQVEEMPSPGTLKFDVDGRTYSLDAVIDREHPGLFVLFKDTTSGHGTYPPGRFLYTAHPASDGTVELDFNRAFTPPCAFTSFATCPLAPRQNHLPLQIDAGERFAGH